MADNYLEKKMDDYRRGVNRSPRRSVVSSPAGVQELAIEPGRVALFVEDYVLLEVLVTTFRRYRFRVAFAWSDRRAGASLAQSSGALYVPVDDAASVDGLRFLIDTVDKRWEGVDAFITDIPACVNSLSDGVRVAPDIKNVKKVLVTARSNSEQYEAMADCNLTTIILPDKVKTESVAVARTALLLMSPLAAAVTSVVVEPGDGLTSLRGSSVDIY